MPNVVIIGGGIAGCCSALELAKKGHQVTILEQADDILQGTSARTPGRMGLGYHYFDFDTAKRYMEQTVHFMRHYSDCFIGSESEPHLQHGRYFVTKDSIIPLQELMATYSDISEHFDAMCTSDPKNKVFEGTHHLHRSMKPKEFQNDVNMDKVAFAIETRECLLDWSKFSDRLKREVASSPNIKIKTGFEASNFAVAPGGGFNVSTKSGESEKADFMVNCSWQNVDFLNEKLGIGFAHSKKEDPEQATTARLKLLAEVELPEALRNKHSMFFCVGPHAMFSNLGNGQGRITYAPVTNFATTTESEMPNTPDKPFKRWLTEGLNEKESKLYGQKIIDGVAEYIPAMRDAKLVAVIPGIVKSKGAMNLSSPDELSDKTKPFHKRDYSGVEEQQIGWVDNSAMKLFYCLGNAEQVAAIIEKQEARKQEIRNVIDFASAGSDEFASKAMAHHMTYYLERNFRTDERINYRMISETMSKKEELGKAIKSPSFEKLLPITTKEKR